MNKTKIRVILTLFMQFVSVLFLIIGQLIGSVNFILVVGFISVVGLLTIIAINTI